MVEIDIDLSTSSLNRAVSKLRNLSSSLQAKAIKCATELAEDGEDELATQITFISNFDGNDKGIITSTPTSDGAEIQWKGNQVDFLEFGTGPNGTMLPYPIKDKYPSYWEYRDTPWTYYNVTEWRYILTYGIPAYAPMLTTATLLNQKATILKRFNGILSRRG